MSDVHSTGALRQQPEAVDQDRELLELAALAAGIEGEWMSFWGSSGIAPDDPNTRMWNPLLDGGDCARMESKIRLGVHWYDGHVFVRSSDWKHIATEHFADHDGDSHSARLRASVRAAAAIGSELRKTASGSHQEARSDEQGEST